MPKRATPLELYKHIDKSNCKDCGYDTCMAFVTDLLERKTSLEDCTHLQKDPKQKKKLEKLQELIMPPQLPVEVGTGPRAMIVGGEEVYYRHQLTWFNATKFAIEVHDLQDNFEASVQHIDQWNINRMGDDLNLDAIAVRCASNDPDIFAEKVITAAELSDLPLILCSWNIDALKTAALAIPDKKPLLYAATKDNWKEVGAIAREHNLPVVCFSPDVDELLSIAASLEKMGVTQLCLDPGTFYGPGLASQTYNKINALRWGAIVGGDPKVKYPIVGVPATVWLNPVEGEKWQTQYQEAIMGCVMQSIDTSLVIMRTGRDPEDAWALLAMVTMRQNIFSDPRIYPAVDPGLLEIGSPDRNSPVFVTCNYRMTKIPVEEDIAAANLDAYLLVVDSGGIAVEAAVVGGQFNNNHISEAIEEFKLWDKVDHRIVIIPGHAARFSGALEDDANCVVIVGSKDSSGIPQTIKARWDPEKLMKEFADR